jgi:hypothetical protein
LTFGDLIEDTDRAVQDHLGSVAVCYAPEVGPEVTETPRGEPLRGMFDENYVLAASDLNGVETIAPAIVLRLEDLPTDPAKDKPKLTILGKLYSVRLREADGTIGGSIRLVLRRQDL